MNEGILRRVLLMAIVLLLCMALFFGGLLLYYASQTNQIKDTISAFEQQHLSAFLYDYTPQGYESEIEEQMAVLETYLGEEMFLQTEAELSEAAGLLASGAAKITLYDKLVKDISVDYRYGGVRATVHMYVDYDGYGSFIGQEGEETAVYAGFVTQTMQMIKQQGAWKIDSIQTEYEEIQ
ncbi:MAG: hypothetical protein HFE78_01105 [Clostridiales bacterium]|nr:hypothetical protein [Clostridiales bacterium]